MPRLAGTNYLPAGATAAIERKKFNPISKLVGAVLWVFKNPRRLLITFIVLAVTAALGYSYFLYTNSQTELKNLKTNPQAAAVAAVEEAVAAVGALMELPTDETPTLATVTDAEKLKTQAFFAKAQNGDKVLLYPNNRLAILYSPEANKIISVGTINVQTSGQ
uniref:Uncharacterized protein n=1 Tax=candidate division WWE3 bacterium TaxID=2053526 RepID=A0A832DUU6_UNCKA